QIYENNGHKFRTKTFTVPAACHYCQDVLWGASLQGLECYGCKFVCHKNCYTLINTTCSENTALKSAKPLYFMTANIKERNKWIQGLELLRK
ncbi:hypothetical protein ROZALSC1DRAFT_5994, partial [Rozella allomycis CSF55]